MIRFTLIAILLGSLICCYGQVTKSDMISFGKNLYERRLRNIGISPLDPEYISSNYGNLHYNGVNAVSARLMADAFPEHSPHVIDFMFERIGLDRTVLNKFIYQVFVICDGEKRNILKVLRSLCGSTDLANHIYDGYIKENPRQAEHFKKLIDERIKNENAEIAKHTFSIPIKTEDSSDLTYKHKNISQVTFLSPGAQFKDKMGNEGIDTKNEYKIIIRGLNVTFLSPFSGGRLIESYLIDRSELDTANQTQVFHLKDEEEVKRENTLDHVESRYTLKIYWDKDLGYFIHFSSLDKNEYKIFVNRVVSDIPPSSTTLTYGAADIPQPKVSLSRAYDVEADWKSSEDIRGNHELVRLYIGAIGKAPIKFFITNVDSGKKVIQGYDIINSQKRYFNGYYTLDESGRVYYSAKIFEKERANKSNGVFQLTFVCDGISNLAYGTWTSYSAESYKEVGLADLIRARFSHGKHNKNKLYFPDESD